MKGQRRAGGTGLRLVQQLLEMSPYHCRNPLEAPGTKESPDLLSLDSSQILGVPQ